MISNDISFEFNKQLKEQANKGVSVIMVTGVSGSGKTTLKDYMLETYSDKLSAPVQFTTRERRFDTEYDDYVFLTKPQYFRKLNNGDFCEYVRYGAQFYAVGKYFKNSMTSIVVVDPVWREAMKKYCAENSIPYLTVYLGISEDVMEYRLGMLRRSSVKEIEERKKDFLYFNSMGSDLILDGTKDTAELAGVIMKHIENFGFGRLTSNNV